MYQPRAFAQNEKPSLNWALQNAGLSTVYSTILKAGCEEPEVFASHIPLFFDPTSGSQGTLFGHFAKANPHQKALKRALLDQSKVVTIITVTLADAYISPTWYPEKKTDGGKVVPTWDYIGVQCRGKLSLIEDDEELERKVLVPLTNKHEERLNNTLRTDTKLSVSKPWRVSETPTKYLRMMKASIQGFRFDISRMEGSWKLSQNKTHDTLKSVVAGLQELSGCERNKTETVSNSFPADCASQIRKASKL